MAKKMPFQQSVYHPTFKDKYKGTLPICCRSSWESRLATYLDHNKACVQWGSESCVIPYVSPLDGKVHRYFVDFNATFKDKEGNLHKYLIEVKPYKETHSPRVTNTKKQSTLINEQATWLKNKAKWDAAQKYAKQKGCEFIILTERELFVNNRC